MTDIVACPHPFKTDRVDLAVPDGLTIAQILEVVQPRPELRSHAHVFVGDLLIPQKLWDVTRPKAGHKLTVRMVPAGGGGKKNPIAAVLSIVVMAGAIMATGGAFATAGGLFAKGSMSAAFLGAGIGIAGSMAVNAIAPPPRPKLGQLSGADGKTSQTYSIAGGRNRMAAYSPIPRLYGRHLLTPPYGAAPYTELEGQEQYLRMVYLLGYGPMDISDIKIGETPIDQFEGVEVEIRQGNDDDGPLSLFPGQVFEDTASLPAPLTQSGDWITRTSQPNSDELSFDITFSGGLYRFDSSGNKQTFSVEFEAQYRPVGTDDWFGIAPRVEWATSRDIVMPKTYGSWRIDRIVLDVATGAPSVIQGIPAQHDDVGFTDVPSAPATPSGKYSVAVVEWGGTIFGGGGVTVTDARDPVLTQIDAGHFLATFVSGRTINVAAGSFPSSKLIVTAAKTQAVRYGQTIRNLERGQYEVRVRRITADSTDDKIGDLSYLTAVRSIRNEDPIAISGVAKIALRIKASEQLSGVVDQLSCIGHSVLPAWNGAEWVERPTSNPAAIYRDILQGRANPRRVSDSRIDMNALQELAEECDAKGWQFNGVIDFRTTIFQLLNDVASTGRASFGMRDGKYSIVRDMPQTLPVQHFTPRNSWGFRGEKAFTDLPHAIKIRFINAEAGYRQDERIVYDDGYTAENATKFETMDLFGVTSPSQAWSQGRYYLAHARLRPETYSLNVDVEHIVCTRGDLVRVSHDVTLHGIAAARVKSVTFDGDNATGCTIDELVPMEAGKTYALRFRLADGMSILAAVDTVEGETSTFTFTAPLADAPEPDDLCSFGETGLETVEMIVTRIEMLDDLAARLILVDAAPAVHTADESIPAYDPQITKPLDVTTFKPGVPEILSIVSDERALITGPDGSIVSRIIITALPTTGAAKTETLQAQYRSGGLWQSLTVAGGEAIVDDVDDGQTYEVRVRALSSYGVPSAWRSAVHTVIGKTSPPPDVTSFLVRRDSDGTRVFTWETVNPPLDLAGAQIRYKAGTGHAWADMAPLHTGLLKSSPYETNQLAAGTYTFAVKNIDTTGLESLAAKFIEITIGDPRLAGAIDTIDDYADQWPGTKTGCYRDPATGFLYPLDNSDWTEIPATWAGWSSWNHDPVSPVVYERQYDVGIVTSFIPLVNFTADGTATVEISHSDDGSSWSSYIPAGTIITARYLRVRISVAGAYPVINSLVTTLSAQPVEEYIDDIDTSTLAGSYRIGTGDIRLPITKPYAVIKKASIVLQNVGAGWSWELIDKDSTVGPRVKIYNSSGVLADAVIDAEIRGV